MSTLIDISVPVHGAMPTWPGSTGFRSHRTMEIARGAAANVSQLDMDVHCGTHVEAPLHFLADGVPIGELPLDRFFGPALVVDLGDVNPITVAALDAAAIPGGTRRLLLKTRNSRLWSSGSAFRADYAALTKEAAEWIALRGVELVGIDYLSIQRYEDDPETHRVLMRRGVAILEGLDLAVVSPGEYTLLCLPLRIPALEATPVRAVLVQNDGPRDEASGA